MGQKVNPIGFRVGVNRNWRSMWYASKRDFPVYVYEDAMIRRFIKRKLEGAAVSRVTIERASNRVRVNIHTARPGVVIGRKASELDKLKDEVRRLTAAEREVLVDVKEIKNPELDAQLVAENIALQIERRISFRRAMKKALQTTIDMGGDGIRVRCSGRLGGAEIARTEEVRSGRVPLHTLRADIDYGFAEARTTAGQIGIKVWICRKEEEQAPANTRS
jgi:small subunit ribosomal protein S3